MKVKKIIKPFGRNIKYFIYANEMTRPIFADELNNRLQNYGLETKIYTANDIWTYDSRGSFPKDSNVLTAIAEIIGKPLEEILTVEFDMNELKRPTKDSTVPRISNARCEWNINKLNELTDAERDFVLDLITTGVYEEDGKWHSFLDIGLRYNKGKSVSATLYYGDDYSKEKILEWSWQEYGEYMQEIDDEDSIIEMRMESDILDNLYSIGLIRDTYCNSCNFDELLDERYSGIDGYFVAKILFNIDKNGIIQLMEKVLEQAENKLAKLVEHSKIIEWQVAE